MRLFLLLFFLSMTAQALPDMAEARYRNGDVLVRFVANAQEYCTIVPQAAIEKLTNDWQTFTMVLSQEVATCADVQYVTAPNGIAKDGTPRTDRPARQLIDGVLEDRKDRVGIDIPCFGEPFLVTRSGSWMQVKPGLYALCRVK